MEHGVRAELRDHWAPVYRFVLKGVGRPAEAEDLAQAVMLEALRCAGRFRGGSSLSAWLFGIAHNLVRRHWRQQRPQSPLDGFDLETDFADADTPEEALSRRREARRLRDALSRLPEDFREAVQLVSLNGLSYEDAARVAGVPVGTIRSRLARARRMLREAMENEMRPAVAEEGYR